MVKEGARNGEGGRVFEGLLKRVGLPLPVDPRDGGQFSLSGKLKFERDP